MVPADDTRGQTLLHDMEQFDDDARRAATALGKNAADLRYNDTDVREDAFAWVYALRSGMIS